jgi:hypothetical protein
MKYGWTPEQLERVNARRAARGQKQLSQGGEYSGQYSRRRKGIEEEDDETQVVSKTPRLDEYKKMLADREKEKAIAKAPRVLSSPYGTEMGSLA